MPESNFTREELYAMVWETPISRLAEQLQITAVELRKIGRNDDIPLPTQGYWARKQFGKPVEQPPLPSKPETTPVVLQPVAEKTLSEPIYFPGEKELTFRVPDRLTHPDPVIVEAERSLKEDHFYDSKDNIVRTDWQQLPIRVSQANIGRALRIMDTLIKCWRQRNYEIVIEQKETYVYLRKVKQRIGLREVTKKLPKKGEYDRQEYQATGQLAFRMDWWMGREWKDGNLLLEEQIFDILNHMEVAARQLERSWDETRQQNEREQQIIRRENDKQLQIENERLSFQKLLQDSRNWKESQILREYLKEMEAHHPMTPEFVEWLTWAKTQADRHDPMMPNM